MVLKVVKFSLIVVASACFIFLAIKQTEFLSDTLSEKEKLTKTSRELRKIRIVTQRFLEQGKMPESRDVIFTLYKDFRKKDAWGTEYKMRASMADIQWISFGPDKKQNTIDDIVEVIDSSRYKFENIEQKEFFESGI